MQQKIENHIHNVEMIFPREILRLVFFFVLATHPSQHLFVNKLWRNVSEDAELGKELFRKFVGSFSLHVPDADKINWRKHFYKAMSGYNRLKNDRDRLGYAVYNGYQKFYEALIENNPLLDLHFYGSSRFSLFSEKVIHSIHLAAMGGHMWLIEKLLFEDPTLINKQDINGLTPLFYACANNKIEVVKLLLDKNATCDAELLNISLLRNAHYRLYEGKSLVTDSECYGMTPLHIATKNNHHECVALLLQHINDTNQEKIITALDYSVKTPLHYACANNDLNMVQLLGGKAVNNYGDRENLQTPLHIATIKNNVEIVQHLLAHDNGLAKLPDRNSNIPIYYACKASDQRMIELLYENNHDIYSNTAYLLPEDLVPSEAVNKAQITNFFHHKNPEAIQLKKINRLLVVLLITAGFMATVGLLGGMSLFGLVAEPWMAIVVVGVGIVAAGVLMASFFFMLQRRRNVIDALAMQPPVDLHQEQQVEADSNHSTYAALKPVLGTTEKANIKPNEETPLLLNRKESMRTLTIEAKQEENDLEIWIEGAQDSSPRI